MCVKYPVSARCECLDYSFATEASTGLVEKFKMAAVKKAVKAKAKRPAAKRELIDTGTDKRYVRRDKKGQFKDVVDVGLSLAADRRSKAKTVSKPGQGDRGDRKARK